MDQGNNDAATKSSTSGGELMKLLERLRRECPPAFENADYEVRITYTLSTDMRIMSFYDYTWEFEVTGGVDQFEPLTIISVRRDGRACEAGMQVGDVIHQINDTPADDLTLMEAWDLIRRSKYYVRIYVSGDITYDESDGEYTVDLWYTIPKAKDPGYKWQGVFPWNDKNTKILRESNCFLVPSKLKSKFQSKFEPPPAARELPKVYVESIWNKKWHLNEDDYEEESFFTYNFPMPKRSIV